MQSKLKELWIFARFAAAAVLSFVVSVIMVVLLPSRSWSLGVVATVVMTLFYALTLVFSRLFLLRPSSEKAFQKGAVVCALAFALSMFIVVALIDVHVCTIREPDGVDAIGPCSISGLPFPCKANCPGDSIPGNIARNSYFNILYGATFLTGLMLLPFASRISPTAKRVAIRLVAWSAFLGLICSALLFVLNWQ